MANSTVAAKPSKPYPDFPLYAHNSKRWAKKIKGRTHFFGHWNNWQAALERFQYENDYLQQGKTPPPKTDGRLTIGDLVNDFLAHRDAKLQSGDLRPITFADYKRIGAKLIEVLGRYTTVETMQPDDFAKLKTEISNRGGLMNLASEMSRCKTILNFAEKNYNIRVFTGMAFDKPSRTAIKREAETKPKRIFSVDELRTLYHAADKHMKCFILLALNGGMGNNDIGLIEPRHIVKGWIDFPRPKTLVARKFPLWKETQKSIDLARQTKHPELPYVFATKYGNCWAKDIATDTPIGKEFTKLCQATGLHQAGRGFYALRHTFRTVADGCRDQVAINHIMGHSDESMAANYREWIEPERLQAVVDHVYAWVKPMFKKPAKKAGAK